jgi:CHC2-type zinc finger protein
MSREEIIAANPIVDFVRSRGHELKPAGPNFVTNGCPVTEHKKKWHRPVGIDVKKQLWFCNDCKLGGTVIDWVMREKGCDAAQAIRELGGGGNDKEERGQIVCAYDYTDEGGKVIFQICRKDPKSDFPVRRPDGRGNWIWNVQGMSRVLYRLPEVLKAQTVCVAEGEKDCDNLVKLGFVATTNPFGAGKWRDEYSETLRGKDVVVFGDVGEWRQ